MRQQATNVAPVQRKQFQYHQQEDESQQNGVQPVQNDHPVAGRAVMVDVLKGGVGKSTVSMNLADRLSARGHNVLYMDLDPNGHSTSVLGFDEVYHDVDHDYGYVVSEAGYYAKKEMEPQEMVYETEWGWDFVPSYNHMENFDVALRSESNATSRLADEFLRPLFESGAYDYCVMDGGGERSKVADNGFYAGRQALIPIQPGKESVSALQRTNERVVKPLKKSINDFKLLAIVPNLLSERIDQRTKDRVLLERLNAIEEFCSKLPSFARISDEEFERIDAGEEIVLPGIRRDAAIANAITEGVPVAQFEPEDCSQIDNFDELARIVENGGVQNE